MHGPEALLVLLALPFLAALAAAFLPAHARNLAAWLATGATLLGLGLTAALFAAVSDTGVLHSSTTWAPRLGLEFTLRLDGFSWLFLVLIFGIGLLVSIYARYYMSADEPVPRLFSLLLGFAGSMVGIVLSSNIIQMVVFWEMTSILSFLLIGYWHHGVAAREGARMALVVTSAGGLCLLVGLLLIGRVAGSYDLDAILAAGDLVRASPVYGPALMLILAGAFTKSAQFPFHFWLPHAMAAPTPVSAYLHSATMVKAGVFLLVRFWPVLSGTDLWFWIVGSAGLATLALGAYLAMFQQDMKGVLAYSTISHLGLITFLLGLNSALACVAAVFHIVNHALFKASLFMAAGAVDHEVGTRDMRKLGGLARFMPVTTALATISAAAMAGVPLLNGFLSKEMFFEETLAARTGGEFDLVPTIVAVVASAFAVVYSLRFIGAVFYGPPSGSLPRLPHEPPFWMLAPIGLLAVACVAVGTLPALTIGPSLRSAAAAVLGERTPEFSLAVWHGVTPALLTSMVALAAGTGAYIVLRTRLRAMHAPPLLGRVSGKRLFEYGLHLATERVPAWIEQRLPDDQLQPQLLLVVLATLLAAGLAVAAAPFTVNPVDLSAVDPAFALLWLIGAFCAVAAAAAAKFHRVAALILAGGAGLICSISFVWLSAPDLATTQLLVEVVTTILILLGLRWLPPRMKTIERRPLGTQLRRVRDAVVAVAAGLGMAVLAYSVMTHPVDDSVSQFYLGRAFSEGGGHNVVNVILVDFRAFDTLGEITVLGIVALSIFALLRRFRPAPESVPPPSQQTIQAAQEQAGAGRGKGFPLAEYMRVPGLIIRMMFPIILLFAVHLYLRGHDLPGGGFSAGLTISVALILLYMAGGVRWVETRLRVAPVRWIAAGLLTAAAAGWTSLLLGYPFLTSYFRHTDAPLLGRAPLLTVMLFDLGVLVLVAGATTLILTVIAHQSLRRPQRPRPPRSGDRGPEGPA